MKAVLIVLALLLAPAIVFGAPGEHFAARDARLKSVRDKWRDTTRAYVKRLNAEELNHAQELAKEIENFEKCTDVNCAAYVKSRIQAQRDQWKRDRVDARRSLNAHFYQYQGEAVQVAIEVYEKEFIESLKGRRDITFLNSTHPSPQGDCKYNYRSHNTSMIGSLDECLFMQFEYKTKKNGQTTFVREVQLFGASLPRPDNVADYFEGPQPEIAFDYTQAVDRLIADSIYGERPLGKGTFEAAHLFQTPKSLDDFLHLANQGCDLRESMFTMRNFDERTKLVQTTSCSLYSFEIQP